MILTSAGKGVVGLRADGQELLDRRTALGPGRERVACRLEVARVDRLLVVGRPVDPDRGDEEQVVDLAAGTTPAATDSRTPCATPAWAAPQVSAACSSPRMSALFTNRVEGFTGMFGCRTTTKGMWPCLGVARAVAHAVSTGPALPAEDRVHMSSGGPAPGEALSDQRSLGEAQKTITPRATSPAFMAAKASLISSSV